MKFWHKWILWCIGTFVSGTVAAELRVCNESDKVVEISIVYREASTSRWRGEGWWSVKPGACNIPLRGKLWADNAYYVLPRADGKLLIPLHSLTDTLCFKNVDFRVTSKNCGLIASRLIQLPISKSTHTFILDDGIFAGWTIHERGAKPNESATQVEQASSTEERNPSNPLTRAFGMAVRPLGPALPPNVESLLQEQLRPLKDSAKLYEETIRALPRLIEEYNANKVGNAVPLPALTPLALNEQKACRVIHHSIPKPKLTMQRTGLGYYTDVLTPPQSRTTCTEIKDTGVTDLGSCTTRYDGCAWKQDTPFGGSICVPGTHTSCTNIKICNTYRTDFRTMQCTLQLQFKLPEFIDKPVSEFVDKANNLIRETENALPLQCAPTEIRKSIDGNVPNVAQTIRSEFERRFEEAVRHEVQAWLRETAIKTVAAALPSGGLAGAGLMTSSLAELVIRVHGAVKPLMTFLEEAKELAEDLGFQTSCGWSDWR